MLEGILVACILSLAASISLFVGARLGKRYYMPLVYYRLSLCARLGMLIASALLLVALVLTYVGV